MEGAMVLSVSKAWNAACQRMFANCARNLFGILVGWVGHQQPKVGHSLVYFDQVGTAFSEARFLGTDIPLPFADGSFVDKGIFVLYAS